MTEPLHFSSFTEAAFQIVGKFWGESHNLHIIQQTTRGDLFYET